MRIEKLFACLAASKHLKFTAAYPTEGAVNVAKIVWQRGLKELRDAEIAAGINALANWQPSSGEDRMPTLTEFKNLLCPRIPITRPLLNDNKEFKLADAEIAKKHWQELSTSASGPLKTMIDKILKRYEI